METLIQELAKTLKIGNDQLQTIIDSYPQLRTQFVWYNSLEIVLKTNLAIMCISVVILTLAGLLWMMENDTYDYTEQKDKILKKTLKISGIILVTTIALSLVINILQTIISPDYTILQYLINK